MYMHLRTSLEVKESKRKQKKEDIIQTNNFTSLSFSN